MSPKKTLAQKETPSFNPKKVSKQTLFLGILSFAFILQSFYLFSLAAKVKELTPGAEGGSTLSDIFGPSETDAEVDEAELSTLLFDFVDNLGTYETNKARYEANLTALQTQMQQDFWTEELLALQNVEGTYTEDGLVYHFSEGSDSYSPAHPILTLVLSYDGALSLDAYGSEIPLKDEFSVEATVLDLKSYLTDQLEALRLRIQTVNSARAAVTAFVSSPDFQSVMTQKLLKLVPESDERESYLYVFQNVEGASVSECRILKIDASFVCRTLAPEAQVDGADFAAQGPALLELFENVDARSDLQKKVDEQKTMLSEVLKDPAFQAALGNAKLTFGPSVETDSTIQYPVLNEAGETLRLLILDKNTAEVKVTLPDGREAQNLSAAVQLLEYSSKKKLWISPVSSRTMLS